jgi:hypothetical protein
MKRGPTIKILPYKVKYEVQYQEMNPEGIEPVCVWTNAVCVSFILNIMEKKKFEQLPL